MQKSDLAEIRQGVFYSCVKFGDFAERAEGIAGEIRWLLATADFKPSDLDHTINRLQNLAKSLTEAKTRSHATLQLTSAIDTMVDRACGFDG